MFLSFFLIFILLTIVYLLFVPLVIFIDTDTGQYYIQLKGLAKASIIGHTKEVIELNLKVFF